MTAPPPIVTFRPMEPEDLPRLKLQPSQHWDMGLYRTVHDAEDARGLIAAGPAWTGVARDGRILGCAGFGELWPNAHAVAWAMLAEGLGPAHLAITRFVRARLADAPYRRIEAIVRAGHEAPCQWARLVGMEAVAVLRRWGPADETHLLFERIR